MDLLISRQFSTSFPGTGALRRARTILSVAETCYLIVHMTKVSQLFSHPQLAPFLIQLMIAYTWVESGWEKLAKGSFPADISKSLAAFANKNPHSLYANGILMYARQNAEAFGQLVQWGELLTGLGLVASVLVYLFLKNLVWRQIAVVVGVLAFLGGMLMSINFYYAAGWMSVSTSGLNALLFWLQLILMLNWIKEGQPLWQKKSPRPAKRKK